MPSLNEVLNELESIYLKEKNTVRRYDILQEVEIRINALRENTIKNLVDKELTSTDHYMARLRKIFSDVPGVHQEVVDDVVQIDSDLTYLYDVLWMDSLDVVETIMAIEDEFNVEISDNEAEKLKTVSDILKIIQK
jgi:acyl carrier protein